jgi:benzil reductase ((S)-benzoin forming)
MKTYIITGASKGLGKSIARECFREGSHCILVSRTINEELKREGEQKGALVTYLEADLGDTNLLENNIEKIFQLAGVCSELVLINNASVVEPIKPAGKLDLEPFEISMKVNFLAPVILIDEFIKRTRNHNYQKKIVNISSGAALRPYHGWGAYCSTKAGLEMFTRVSGLEQGKEKNPVILISFSPGKMDTGMQATIRTADEKDFADAALFNAYKEQGELRTADFVARKLMELLEANDLENGGFYDIKNLI